MVRKIITIDNALCNGCELCVNACHEGAIGMKDGKAVLLRDDYCDGLGDCLPVCPTGAITFEEREAAEFDKQAVEANMSKKPLPCGCPGTASKSFDRPVAEPSTTASAQTPAAYELPTSQLRQWPVQIKLVPVNAPYFDGAKLLIAADCAAYAYANFHQEYIRGRVTLIGCPKLDDGDYSEKLAEILSRNDIKSVTVVRMEVPCCAGIERATITALEKSGKMIPWQVVTITTDGQIVDSL